MRQYVCSVGAFLALCHGQAARYYTACVDANACNLGGVPRFPYSCNICKLGVHPSPRHLPSHESPKEVQAARQQAPCLSTRPKQCHASHCRKVQDSTYDRSNVGLAKPMVAHALQPRDSDSAVPQHENLHQGSRGLPVSVWVELKSRASRVGGQQVAARREALHGQRHAPHLVAAAIPLLQLHLEKRTYELAEQHPDC